MANNNDNMIGEIMANIAKHNPSILPQNTLFVDALWQRASEYKIHDTGRSLITMMLPMKINDISIDGIIDTGAEINMISMNTAKSLGITEYIDTRYKSNAMGIGGTVKVLGVIPCIDVHIGEYVVHMMFSVQDGDFKPLIGMRFLRHYGAKIDMEKMRMTIAGSDIDIKIVEKS